MSQEYVPLSEKDYDAMLEAAKPLIAWLNEFGHPHCRAVVDQTTIQLFSGVAVRHTDEFLRD